jgi:hypothetical protein
MWGKWVENNPKVKNLQYYVVHNILNYETSVIVPRAMRNKLAPSLSIWPGTVFDKDKDKVEFQALIGTFYAPNSRFLPTCSPCVILLHPLRTSLPSRQTFLKLY